MGANLQVFAVFRKKIPNFLIRHQKRQFGLEENAFVLLVG
jgi:hypothetical protein